MRKWNETNKSKIYRLCYTRCLRLAWSFRLVFRIAVNFVNTTPRPQVKWQLICIFHARIFAYSNGDVRAAYIRKIFKLNNNSATYMPTFTLSSKTHPDFSRFQNLQSDILFKCPNKQSNSHRYLASYRMCFRPHSWAKVNFIPFERICNILSF